MHRSKIEENRRAFSDLIIESFTDDELNVLDLLVEAAMLPEDEDGRQVMDDDPATLSDWRYQAPKFPTVSKRKSPLIRNPFTMPGSPGYDEDDFQDLDGPE